MCNKNFIKEWRSRGLGGGVEVGGESAPYFLNLSVRENSCFLVWALRHPPFFAFQPWEIQSFLWGGPWTTLVLTFSPWELLFLWALEHSLFYFSALRTPVFSLVWALNTLLFYLSALRTPVFSLVWALNTLLFYLSALRTKSILSSLCCGPWTVFSEHLLFYILVLEESCLLFAVGPKHPLFYLSALKNPAFSPMWAPNTS